MQIQSQLKSQMNEILSKLSENTTEMNHIPVSTSSFHDLAQLGPILQAYFTFKTLISIDWKTFGTIDWHSYVQNQVKIINDSSFDIDKAYELLEDKQKFKCKKCNADLTMDREPVVQKTQRHVEFFNMHTVDKRFSWICKTCLPSKRVISRDERAKMLDEKIHKYTLEEGSPQIVSI